MVILVGLHLRDCLAMQVLENRLEQAERRFCETLAKNKEMREQIESINKQRETFEQVRAWLP